LLDPAMFDEPVRVLAADPSLPIANIMNPITSFDELRSPNIVKVVTDRRLRALYMSRQPIPTQRGSGVVNAYKQTGFIFFRTEYLKKYLRLEPTPGEVAESVDMNRVLEHGDPIQMVISNRIVMGVDEPDDIPKVEAVLKDDALFRQYAR
jgi:3-deoxy-manno-octulosonate cytidylyltransferase (CMP-KDO synthetase)